MPNNYYTGIFRKSSYTLHATMPFLDEDIKKNVLTTPVVQPVKENKTPTPPKSTTPVNDLLRSVIANVITMGVDFSLTSFPYGLAMKSEATVSSPKWQDIFKASEWAGAYKRSWGVLKYGFYPAYGAEVVASKISKLLDAPEWLHHIMPGFIGATTASAISIQAINARHKLQLDMLEIIKKEGIKGVTKLTAGPGVIGLREALCFHGLNTKREPIARKIAELSAPYKTTAYLFTGPDGSPTPMAHYAAYIPGLMEIIISQPLTMIAVNGAIAKYQLQNEGGLKRPKITSPLALLNWQLKFAKLVYNSILDEGKKTGLQSWKSFSPGFVPRCISLIGTYGIFQTCLDPIEKTVGENITHRKKI